MNCMSQCGLAHRFFTLSFLRLTIGIMSNDPEILLGLSSGELEALADETEGTSLVVSLSCCSALQYVVL
jgi:hypothetical protein